MYNQICPWQIQSQNIIQESDILSLNTIKNYNNQQPKRTKINKRPQTCKVSQTKRQQKKTIRPSSGQRSLQLSRKKSIFVQPQTTNQTISLKQECQQQNLMMRSTYRSNNFQVDHNNNKRKVLRNVSEIFLKYPGFSRCKVKRDERPNSILSKQMLENSKKQESAKLLKKQCKMTTKQLVFDNKLASVLKMSNLTKNSIRSSFINHKKQVMPVPVLKKIGFVYYNQSFLQYNPLRNP